MITYKDIFTSVNTVILDHFPTIEIQSSDVSEGFQRPSFFVSFDNMGKSSTEEQIQRTMTIRLYYFPTNRNECSIELLDTQEKLESAFDLKLNVLERKFNINEVSTEVTDGVLNFSFDIEYYEGKDTTPYDNTELMQSLDIKEG